MGGIVAESSTGERALVVVAVVVGLIVLGILWDAITTPGSWFWTLLGIMLVLAILGGAVAGVVALVAWLI